ncbi:MAG: dehydrogenase [Ramlibacter sp.]|nr:dehydrogenase [Ramlibacter sp.]
MHVLVVYCHPVETSFASALHQEVLRNLRAAGHSVDDCDLYAEDFNPVMSREERLRYHDVPRNREPVAGYVERLHRADAIVFCFPVTRRTSGPCSRTSSASLLSSPTGDRAGWPGTWGTRRERWSPAT